MLKFFGKFASISAEEFIESGSRQSISVGRRPRGRKEGHKFLAGRRREERQNHGSRPRMLLPHPQEEQPPLPLRQEPELYHRARLAVEGLLRREPVLTLRNVVPEAGRRRGVCSELVERLHGLLPELHGEHGVVEGETAFL